jgi:anti-sigma factor RsiW
VGGRLDVVRQQRAVALVYKRREHVINLLMVEAARGSNATALAEVQGYHLISWTEGGLAYWAVSDLNSRELGDFVQLVRRK